MSRARLTMLYRWLRDDVIWAAKDAASVTPRAELFVNNALALLWEVRQS
jgi:hypothetical protein